MSGIFSNIDGNASNFDAFVAEIASYGLDFTYIGIAETNVSRESGDLYTIPGYTAEYNDKIDNKSKGTGTAIYIKSNLAVNRVENICKCSPNLESIIVKTSNTKVPYYFGVVYRPPSGNESDAVKEFNDILAQLPDRNVNIMGDFNINLLDSSSSSFETCIYENNLIPTISLPTHHKPGCKPSLIDNILVNSTDNLVLSGVIEGGVCHHQPIFNLMKSFDCLQESLGLVFFCLFDMGFFEKYSL